MPLFLLLLSCITMLALPPQTQAQSLPESAQGDDRFLPPEAYDPTNIPDAWIDEAMNFNTYCKSTYKMSQYYNCDCLSVRYLDKRVEGGYKLGASAIMMQLEKECLDTANVAGSMRGRCMANINMIPNIDDAETYCDCVGNEYAKFFEDNKIEPNSKNSIRIQSHVMGRCAAQSTTPP